MEPGSLVKRWHDNIVMDTIAFACDVLPYFRIWSSINPGSFVPFCIVQLGELQNDAIRNSGIFLITIMYIVPGVIKPVAPRYAANIPI